MSEGGEARNHELREKIADALAENDQCGVGPLSRQEYLDDAEAILSLIRTYGGTRDAVRRSPQGEEPEVIPWPRELGAQPDGEVAVRYPNGQTGVRPKMSPDKLRSPQDEDREPPCDCQWRISQGYGHRLDCPMLVAHKKQMAEKYGPQDEDHEAGMRAAWAAAYPGEEYPELVPTAKLLTIRRAITAYLSRCPSPERNTEKRIRSLVNALHDVTVDETADEGTPQWYALRNARALLAEFSSTTKEQ